MNKQGQAAEDFASQWLQNQGLEIIERNMHYLEGELDLIAKEQDSVCFIEVKYRKNANFGSACEQVTPAKQDKLRSAALRYIEENTALANSPMRFDVVAITGSQVEWIKDAF
jgi:putative endonuclease